MGRGEPLMAQAPSDGAAGYGPATSAPQATTTVRQEPTLDVSLSPSGIAAQVAAIAKGPPTVMSPAPTANADQEPASRAKPPPYGAPPPGSPIEAWISMPLYIAAQVAAGHAKLPPFGAPPPGSPIEAWAGIPVGRAD